MWKRSKTYSPIKRIGSEWELHRVSSDYSAPFRINVKTYRIQSHRLKSRQRPPQATPNFYDPTMFGKREFPPWLEDEYLPHILVVRQRHFLQMPYAVFVTRDAIGR